MAEEYQEATYRVVLGEEAKSGPMNIADAHNYALKLPACTPVRVAETYEWFCRKCGDDFWTMDETYYQHIKKIGRWRCNLCVRSLL